MQVDTRPLTAEERRALARLAGRGQDLVNDVCGTLLVFVLVFALELGILRIASDEPGELATGVAAAIAIATALGVLLHIRRSSGAWLRRVRRVHAEDLAGGEAQRQTFEVVDAVRVEEREHEGSSFYLALADGSVLFLRGQYLYEPEEEGVFPSTRLVVTRAPRSRIVLDVECPGSPLPASATRAAFSKEDHRAGKVPEDGALLQLDFASLRGPAPDGADRA